MTENGDNGRTHGWTPYTLKILMDERVETDRRLRVAEDKFQTERDRRYSEVKIETEKALKIKEVADLAALQLARDIQAYKDEKANELRSQIERERGTYATHAELEAGLDKIEALIAPGSRWIENQRGRQVTQTEVRTQTNQDRIVLVALIVGIAGVIATFIATHKF